MIFKDCVLCACVSSGVFVPEQMSHSLQNIILIKKNGLAVVSGCTHAGVMDREMH